MGDKDFIYLASDMICNDSDSDDSINDDPHMDFGIQWFLGTEASELPGEFSSRFPASTQRAPDIEQLFTVLQSCEPEQSQLDIVEICGGAARVSHIAIRRRLKTGKNFDIICGFDVNDLETQKKVLTYFKLHKPLVAVMSPMCRPFGRHSNINYQHNYEGWKRSYDLAAPHGRFCGYIALVQIQNNRFFINEQPNPSYLYQEHPWPKVLQHPTVMKEIVHQCMTGQTGPEGGLAYKPTGFVANSPYLLKPLVPFKCDKSHEHEQLDGGKADKCKLWTWTLARAIVSGILLLKTALDLGYDGHYFSAVEDKAIVAVLYPVTETQTESKPKPGKTQPFPNCPGCRGHVAASDKRHIRTLGECRYPDTPTVEYSCPGCRKNKPAGHEDHTYDENCRQISTASRGYSERKGKHPREPTTKAVKCPTADAQAQLPDGSDLGSTAAEASSGSASASSSGPPPSRLASDSKPSASHSSQQSEVADGRTEDEEARVGRGPDARPRVRRTFQESGIGSENPSDWSRFDVTRSLTALRSHNKAVVLRELRKLHLRWWHAPNKSMTNLIKNAGLPNEVLQEIPNIVNTCRECRAWQSKGRDTIPSISLATHFNEYVEWDLMFYKQFIVNHEIDRCTRWHASCEVPSKHDQVLLDAIEKTWVSLHGPPENFIIDGEAALATAQLAKDYFKSKTITVKVRAPQQHARYIERRGAILRHQMHLIEEQCKRENLSISFTRLLGEATFCGNALTFTGNSSPYNAVYGRQPACLPEIPYVEDEMAEQARLPENQRIQQRIREIAVQTIVSTTASGRLTRSLRSTTSPAVEYKPGDMIDYYKEGGSKDVTGWHGPERIIRVKQSDGQVIIKLNSQEYPYRLQDVRHTLFVQHTFFAGIHNIGQEAVYVVTKHVASMRVGNYETYGTVFDDDGRPQTAEASITKPRIHAALTFILRNCLMLPRCPHVRIGRGIRRLSKCSVDANSILFWWFDEDPQNLRIHSCESSAISPDKVIGTNVSQAGMLQAVFFNKNAYSMKQIHNDNNMSCTEFDDNPSSDLTPEVDVATGGPNEAATVNSESGRLSTIPEGSEEDDSEFLAFVSSHFSECSAEDMWRIREVYIALQRESAETDEDKTGDQDFLHKSFYVKPIPNIGDFNVYAHYVSSGLESFDYAEPNEFDESGNPCVDVYFLSGMGKCLMDDSQLNENEFVVMQVLLSGVKTAVIKRDTDILTPNEIRENPEAIKAATLEELTIWQKYKCFTRDWKSNATNLMSSRFVIKWKYITDKDGKKVRIIRMRLAIRGFEDADAEDLVTYSATGARLSQKIISSECACHDDWVIVSVDIDKAFLQGMTYQEIHELTGEDVRNVHFSLPPGADEQLRKLPGFENFDSRYECLKCDKPGTGTKDAPRAFSLKLASVTQNKCGMKPTFYDREFELKHDKHGQLIVANVKHVDDLKLIGPEAEVEAVIAELEAVFGKLKRNYKDFTNCGIRHRQHDNGSVELDQDEYIAALIPIAHPQLVGAKAEEPASEVLIQLFWSLLGAVAYTLMTQHWIAVYVIALQRETSSPKIIHIRRLNAVVRALQKCPAHIVYPRMECVKHLLAHSDSGFSKEQDKGYGIRGANIMRQGKSKSTGNKVYHLLDSVSRSHKNVTRSTFSSETLACVACADDLIPMLVTFHEMEKGTVTAAQARELRENGNFAFKSTLSVDAMSLFTAIAAHTVKIPSEKNLAIHLFWLRELLDRKVLSHLEWCDTRDMSSDCHTKGSIARDVILNLMKGMLSYTQAVKTYPPV